MPYKIQRRPTWIGSALTRLFGADGGSGDTSNPDVIPDFILPKIDVFGWEALQRMSSASSIAAVGVTQVFPTVDANWVTSANGGVVPDDVDLRVMLGAHLAHDDEIGGFPAGRNGRRMWMGLLDRESSGLNGTGIPTETGSVGDIVSDTPLVITKVFFLRSTENFIGRIDAINAARQMRMFYTWVDLQEGEYLASLP